MPTELRTRKSIKESSNNQQTHCNNILKVKMNDLNHSGAETRSRNATKMKNVEKFVTPNKSTTCYLTKNKRKVCSDSEDESNSTESSEFFEKHCSPPKQQKYKESPSRLIDKLSIVEDEDSGYQRDQIERLKFQPRTKYQNAKLSLTCAEADHLPGREKEIEELHNFMLDHLKHSKSGSLYVSGQPGTGKTACLSNILRDEKFADKFIKLYINCTSVSTVGSIYKKICAELRLKVNGKTEKDHLNAIERFITGSHKMVLMVLDEIDQLAGKKQSVLYSIFEWPSKPKAKILIIGIANSLDLTDRLLTRLNAKCDLKPQLLHFAPYTKQQILDIFKSRLENAGVPEVFPPATVQLLAAKVAAINGDVRRALNIGRRVIEIAEQQKSEPSKENLSKLYIEGVNQIEDEEASIFQPVQIKQVVDVLNNVYGTSQKLQDDIEDSFPLQQKILICTLMLMLKKGKNKDITVGRLHDVYKRVCQKRNLLAVDQTEFVGICSLVETRGIIRIMTKKEPRLSKIFLQWDDEEVTAALKDKQLIATILDDTSCLGK